jgi:hypothetical protein
MRQMMAISLNSEKEILEILKILQEEATESDTEDTLLGKLNKVIEISPNLPIVGTNLMSMS